MAPKNKKYMQSFLDEQAEDTSAYRVKPPMRIPSLSTNTTEKARQPVQGNAPAFEKMSSFLDEQNRDPNAYRKASGLRRPAGGIGRR